jgi:hypothetical protein
MRGNYMFAERPLHGVYRLDVEEFGEGVFATAGIVVTTGGGRFDLYCANSVYNRYRRALTKLSWTDLLQGVVAADAEYRLVDLTAEMADRGWTDTGAVPAILRHLYTENPRQYFFLSRHVIR